MVLVPGDIVTVCQSPTWDPSAGLVSGMGIILSLPQKVAGIGVMVEVLMDGKIQFVLRENVKPCQMRILED